MNGIARWIPVGADPRWAKRAILLGLVAGLVVNCDYLFRYLSAREALYTVRGGVRELTDRIIEPFQVLLGRGLYGCLMAAFSMVVLGWYYWQMHHRESKSVYLMRRLPNPYEYPRRCFSLPMFGVILFLVEGFLLWQIDFLIYWFGTPSTNLPPVSWTALWSIW